MYRNKKILALIPARKGSKRIPGKNIIDFAGKPLIAYTIEAALASNCFQDIIVSTDDEEIISVAMQYGATVPFMRPKDLADDLAKSTDVVIHAIRALEEMGKTYELFVFLQPTSPLRDGTDIKNSIDFLLDNDYRSVVSISEDTVNGAIYINYVDDVNPGLIMSANDNKFVMSVEHGVDIDEYRDLELALKYLER